MATVNEGGNRMNTWVKANRRELFGNATLTGDSASSFFINRSSKTLKPELPQLSCKCLPLASTFSYYYVGHVLLFRQSPLRGRLRRMAGLYTCRVRQARSIAPNCF